MKQLKFSDWMFFVLIAVGFLASVLVVNKCTAQSWDSLTHLGADTTLGGKQVFHINSTYYPAGCCFMSRNLSSDSNICFYSLSASSYGAIQLVTPRHYTRYINDSGGAAFKSAKDVKNFFLAHMTN